MTVPTRTQSALILNGTPGTTPPAGSLPLEVSSSHPIPGFPSDHHVLVRVLAVGLNPSDHKMAVHFPFPGTAGGCDFCGIVDQVAPGTAVMPHPPGTRVLGGVFPYRPNSTGGSFAEYVVVDANQLVRVPDHWSDLEAAALGGIGFGTVGMAMSDPGALALTGLPSKPSLKHEPVLVYGGGTATGTLACQLLKESGYDPIAVASNASAAMAKSYGAVGTVSYTSANPLEEIRAAADKRVIRHVLDCITDQESASICMGAIGRAGGRYACLEKCPESYRTRRTVHISEVMGFEPMGVDVDLGTDTTYTRHVNEEAYKIGCDWCHELQTLVDTGRVRPHPVKEIPGRWDGILEGLGRLMKGQVRVETSKHLTLMSDASGKEEELPFRTGKHVPHPSRWKSLAPSGSYACPRIRIQELRNGLSLTFRVRGLLK
ncbi:putative zinc binding dehydrogenase [Stachybotrys elegans]|uniref:Zinc binding dehydrogenase n=1 Tax=Stachybotrys elegans TaxID=80388 RepID=A0A8K0ST94_9HYPO|nr:putative zinc binding dehydrogenase [Stachybotrys elegans]